jgi:HlyD family secretion protein
MRRTLVTFLAAVTVLSGLLGWQVWIQQDALTGPAGGSGVIEGSRTRVASRAGGRITKLAVTEGQQVQAGDLLLQLDCTEARAGLAEAEARVEAARQQAGAADGAAGAASTAASAALAAAGAVAGQAAAIGEQQGAAARQAGRLDALPQDVSEAQRDQARTAADALAAQLAAVGSQRQAAEAQARAAGQQAAAAASQAAAADSAVSAGEAALARVRAAADECDVRATRSGYVQTLPWEEGELVAPGATLAVLQDISVVTAAFYLPNADLAAAWPQREAEIVADAWPDRSFSGRVATVATEAEFTPRNIQTRTDRDRLVYRVEVRLENADGALRPGMPVEVRLVGEAP